MPIQSAQPQAAFLEFLNQLDKLFAISQDFSICLHLQSILSPNKVNDQVFVHISAWYEGFHLHCPTALALRGNCGAAVVHSRLAPVLSFPLYELVIEKPL